MKRFFTAVSLWFRYSFMYFWPGLFVSTWVALTVASLLIHGRAHDLLFIFASFCFWFGQMLAYAECITVQKKEFDEYMDKKVHEHAEELAEKMKEFGFKRVEGEPKTWKN